MNTSKSTKTSPSPTSFNAASPSGDVVEAFSNATKSLKKAGLKLDNLGVVSVTISVTPVVLPGHDDTPGRGVREVDAPVVLAGHDDTPGRGVREVDAPVVLAGHDDTPSRGVRGVDAPVAIPSFNAVSPSGDLIEAFSNATKSLKKAGLKMDSLGVVSVTISVTPVVLPGQDDTGGKGVKDKDAPVA